MCRMGRMVMGSSMTLDTAAGKVQFLSGQRGRDEVAHLLEAFTFLAKFFSISLLILIPCSLLLRTFSSWTQTSTCWRRFAWARALFASLLAYSALASARPRRRWPQTRGTTWASVVTFPFADSDFCNSASIMNHAILCAWLSRQCWGEIPNLVAIISESAVHHTSCILPVQQVMVSKVGAVRHTSLPFRMLECRISDELLKCCGDAHSICKAVRSFLWKGTL